MNDAAAKRYADALYELASDNNAHEPVGEGLLKVRDALGKNSQAATAFLNPRVPAAEKRKIADEKLLDGVHDYVANLVRLLIDRRRECGILSLILSYFELREVAEGIVHAKVEVAMEMGVEELAALTENLSKVIKKKVVAEVTVVPELIGGVRITLGSTLIDGSLMKSLDTLKTRLMAAV